MIIIMLTGNYTFFNLLTIVINITSFDDDFLVKTVPGWVLRFIGIFTFKEEEEKQNI